MINKQIDGVYQVLTGGRGQPGSTMREATRGQPLVDNARVILASLVGTTVEYYDFYIYGFAAALVFGPLFFPTQSPAAQTLFSLMTFSVAFFARPVGAIVFGHFGDRIGRKATLAASMLLMGSCTVAIALVPTYEMARGFGAGWLAPALLCLLRFGQGFGLGGEWAGAALLSIENAPEDWRARFAAIPAIGSIIGQATGMAVFLAMNVALPKAEFAAWGWRLPFLFSAVLVGIALWVRFRIAETPEFIAALQRKPPPRAPLLLLFAKHWRSALAAFAVPAFSSSIGYMSTTFALAEGTGPLGYNRESFLFIELINSLFALPTIWLFARRADQTSVAHVLLRATLVAIPISLMFGPGLRSGSLVVAGFTLCLMQFAGGLLSSTASAWIAGLFPVRVRYTGFAFAFNAGVMIGGAGVPLLGQMLSAAGYMDYAGLLFVIPGLLGSVAVKLARPAEPQLEIAGTDAILGKRAADGERPLP